MQSCFRFLRNRAENADKNTTHLSSSKPAADKSEFSTISNGAELESFSSSVALNPTADSSQTSEFYQRNLPHEATVQENDNESKIDLDAANRAVDVALAGLHLGGTGKRQGSPTTASKQQEVTVLSPTRSRPGFPPKSAVALPKAIYRFAKFVTPHQRQRTSYQDPFNANIQQQQTAAAAAAGYQPTRHNSQDFMLNSADMLNPPYSGCFPGDMRSNFSESDMSNAALWAVGGGGNQTAEEWNMQQQLQSLIHQNPNLAAHHAGVARNWSADFTGNPELAKYVMNNAISEFLMNSSDSWSSKIEVPHQGGSVRADSFSSKIEFPVNCDSFTSKLSAASIRDDSFSSQRLVDPLMLGTRPMESIIMDPQNEAGYNLPEFSIQELESLVEGDVSKEATETAVLSLPMDAPIRSEKNLLLAISGILKCALMGTFSSQDLLSDLNFLIVSVRRHFMDYQSFSSNAAESFLLIGSTLSVVCVAAKFNEDVMASLKKFMMMISTGHPSLKNTACLLDFGPTNATAVELHSSSNQTNEAYQLLAKIHHKLSAELNAASGSNPSSMSVQSPTKFNTQETGGNVANVEGVSGSTLLQVIDNSSESANSESAEKVA
eukprot:g6664.t1